MSAPAQALKPEPSECVEKARLIEDHKAAVEAVRVISQVAILFVKDVALLHSPMDTALEIAERAKATLEAHTSSHSC